MKSASTTAPRPSAAGAKRCAAGIDTIRASLLARHMQVSPMRALAIAICLAALPACGTEQAATPLAAAPGRSEEHTSDLQSLIRISYAVFCLKKKNNDHI